MNALPPSRAHLLRACAFLFISLTNYNIALSQVATGDIAVDVASTSVEAKTKDPVAASTGTTEVESDARAKPTQASQILFIVEDDCSACDDLQKELEPEFQAMRISNWKIDHGFDAHIRIINKSDATEVLKLSEEEANEMQLPNVVAIRGGEVVRYFKSGCSTPLDRWTFDWLFTGVDRRPAPPPIEEITVETTGNYPLRGGHWSVEGDWHPSREKVLTHLRGPNHAQQLKPIWKLEVWSREELRSLHDNLHELEQFGRTNVYSSNITAPKYVAANSAN